MPMSDGSEPAFPGGDGPNAGNPQYYTPGMSQRDYIAVEALKSLLLSIHNDPRVQSGYIDPFSCARDEHVDQITSTAYRVADSMLRARDKPRRETA